ncbi:hypothetical protein Ddc_22594 [Ditylenchus destructor]|nr:hypothetical protein Ddc_22594 [Ditylenchus destructor]
MRCGARGAPADGPPFRRAQGIQRSGARSGLRLATAQHQAHGAQAGQHQREGLGLGHGGGNDLGAGELHHVVADGPAGAVVAAAGGRVGVGPGGEHAHQLHGEAVVVGHAEDVGEVEGQALHEHAVAQHLEGGGLDPVVAAVDGVEQRGPGRRGGAVALVEAEDDVVEAGGVQRELDAGLHVAGALRGVAGGVQRLTVAGGVGGAGLADESRRHADRVEVGAAVVGGGLGVAVESPGGEVHDLGMGGGAERQEGAGGEQGGLEFHEGSRCQSFNRTVCANVYGDNLSGVSEFVRLTSHG